VAGLEQNVQDPLELLKTYAGHWAKCIEQAGRFACALCLRVNCRRCRRKSPGR
jgi:TetR/AcrR family transcriptional repressor of nem operon